jgi:hypothetical protein
VDHGQLLILEEQITVAGLRKAVNC